MAIISHRHKFIFLKTRKTAGSSLEIALARICGPEDLMCPTDEAPRFGIMEQNNQKKIGELTYRDWGQLFSRIVRDVRKNGKPDLNRSIKKLRRVIKSTHYNARNLREACGFEIWNSYYKFCFERNPFDRLVSFYYWRTKEFERPPSFKEFALSVLQGNKKERSRLNATNFSNRPFYEIDGEVVVDKVCKFENLASEMSGFFNMIGVQWGGDLPRMKSGYRPRSNYRDYYDAELRQLCEEMFSREIKLLGYEF